jgi:hypothetical protein
MVLYVFLPDMFSELSRAKRKLGVSPQLEGCNSGTSKSRLHERR